MSKLPTCRLLLEAEPNSGAWNMAVDEVLLDTAATDGQATFRWYRWSEPAVSLGYFQDPAEIQAIAELAGLPRVRRLSGGGAILHDREWTYSFAVPPHQPLFHHPEALYDLVHEAMISVLQQLGCSAEARGTTTKQLPEPLLCFSRRDAHDVVWQGAKILGSAQRRRRGAVLQHGSLLLRHSEFTPEHPGLSDLGFGAAISVADLRRVPEQFVEALSPGELTPREVLQVADKMRLMNLC